MAALDDLAATAGLDRSAVSFLADLPDEEIAVLVDVVEQARRDQMAALDLAVDSAMSTLPRIVRTQAARLLGGSR